MISLPRTILALSLGISAPVLPAHGQTPELTLEQAVASALQENLGLQIQRLQPQIAEQGVIIQDAAFDVNLFGDAGTTRSSRETVGAETDASQYEGDSVTVGASKTIATGGTFTLSTGFDRTESNAGVRNQAEQFDAALTGRFVQPLLQGAWSGYNLAQLRQAESLLAEEQLRLRSNAADLTQDVTELYWRLAHAYARRDLLVSSVEAAQQLADEMQARSERGLVSPIEILQAQASLAERKEALIQAEVGISDAGDSLAQAMGVLLDSPGTGYTPKVRDLPRGETPMIEFETVWPLVLQEDLQTQIQERAIERNDLQKLIAASQAEPQLDAYIQGSLLGNDPGRAGRAYRGALDHDGHSWSAGVQFSMPWGTRGGKAQLRRADLQLEQAKIRLIEMKQDLYQRSRAAWRTLDAGNERLKAARTRVDFEESAFAQAKARYDRGLSSFRELLEAQRDLDSARLTYIDVLRDLAVAKSVLARLDGSIFEQLNFSHNTAPAQQPAQD